MRGGEVVAYRVHLRLGHFRRLAEAARGTSRLLGTRVESQAAAQLAS
jgi:hypothetical protein